MLTLMLSSRSSPDIGTSVALQLALPSCIRASVGHFPIHPLCDFYARMAELPLDDCTVLRIATVKHGSDKVSHQVRCELHAKGFPDDPTQRRAQTIRRPMTAPR